MKEPALIESVNAHSASSDCFARRFGTIKPQRSDTSIAIIAGTLVDKEAHIVQLLIILKLLLPHIC